METAMLTGKKSIASCIGEEENGNQWFFSKEFTNIKYFWKLIFQKGADTWMDIHCVLIQLLTELIFVSRKLGMPSFSFKYLLGPYLGVVWICYALKQPQVRQLKAAIDSYITFCCSLLFLTRRWSGEIGTINILLSKCQIY